MKARLPQGMGGGPGNMGAMMRQVQKFQEEREVLAAALCAREYEIAAGGGAVKLTITGEKTVTNIEIAPEIIDPDTGAPLPLGTPGELVFTCLDKEAFPLIRYRTRDICVLSREKCACGRTLIKMCKPQGRSDDMMIIRGVNVFPSQIETVLLREGYTPNYRIELDRVNNSDTLDIFVELSPEMFSDTVRELTNREKALAAAMRDMIGIGPKIHLVPPHTIERSEGKAVRVIDRRHLHDGFPTK